MTSNKLKGLDIPKLKHKKVYTQEYVDKLVKENNRLAKHIVELQKDKGELVDRERQAKEIIKNIIRVTWGEGWNYSLDVRVKAEQFLKEGDKR